MSWQQLPSEICLEIFQVLPRKTAYECMFVCKPWYLPAKQAFHSELSLSIKNLLLVYMTILEEETSNFTVGHWINKLTLHHERPVRRTHQNIFTRFEPNEFLKLLSLLPNLTTIDLQLSANSDYYMNILRDADNATLPHIKEILPGTGSYSLSQNFFQTFYNFRQTLTHLHIEYADHDFIMEGQTGSMLSFLPNFQCLTHVWIDNNHDNQLSFIDVLNACPQLVKLNFRSIYDIPDPTTTIIDNNAPRYNNLKIIKLGLPKFTLGCMNYFIQHFSADELDTMKLEIQDQDFYGWINKVGKENAIAFAQFLQPVKNLQFYTNNPENSNSILGLPTAQEKITALFTFIDALKGTRDMHCAAICSDSKALEMSIEVTNHTQLRLSYGIYRWDLKDNNVLLLPEARVSTVGLDTINSLTFVVIQDTETFGRKLLNYIFTQCPQVTELEIHNWNPLSQYALNAIHLDDPNCSQMVLKGPPPSQEFIDLISNYIPTLQTLNCKGLVNPKRHIDNKYRLNLTKLANLKEFTFDISNIIDGVIDSKLLVIDYMNAIDYYKIDKPLTETHYLFTRITRQEYNLSTSPFSSNIYFITHPLHTIHIYAKSTHPIARLQSGKLLN